MFGCEPALPPPPNQRPPTSARNRRADTPTCKPPWCPRPTQGRPPRRRSAPANPAEFRRGWRRRYHVVGTPPRSVGHRQSLPLLIGAGQTNTISPCSFADTKNLAADKTVVWELPGSIIWARAACCVPVGRLLPVRAFATWSRSSMIMAPSGLFSRRRHDPLPAAQPSTPACAHPT